METCHSPRPEPRHLGLGAHSDHPKGRGVCFSTGRTVSSESAFDLLHDSKDILRLT